MWWVHKERAPCLARASSGSLPYADAGLRDVDDCSRVILTSSALPGKVAPAIHSTDGKHDGSSVMHQKCSLSKDSFSLESGLFTVLCQFQVWSKVTQLHIYIYPSFSDTFPI